MAAYSHQKKLNKRYRRIIPAVGMLLMLGGGFALWRGESAGNAAKQAEETVLSLSAVPTAEPSAATPAPTPTPEVTAEPGPYTAGEAVSISSYLPDGRRVQVLDQQCYWGMDQLELNVKAHQCRFMTGSGTLLPDYSFGDSIPESDAVDDSYFSDAVFIGNSLEQGFMLYAGLNTADFYATQSITITNIYTEKVINNGSGELLTLLEAMSRKRYGKVFVLLGINELGYSQERFYQDYAKLIDTIRELEPDAQLYLQSMTPVTAEESNSSSMFTNSRIRTYNEIIRQLAADTEAHYLQIFDALTDESGCLPAGSSADGIHPYSRYYSRILDYLKTHTITEVRK